MPHLDVAVESSFTSSDQNRRATQAVLSRPRPVAYMGDDVRYDSPAIEGQYACSAVYLLTSAAFYRHLKSSDYLRRLESIAAHRLPLKHHFEHAVRHARRKSRLDTDPLTAVGIMVKRGTSEIF